MTTTANATASPKQILGESEENYRILHRNRVYGEDLLPAKDLEAVIALENRYRTSLKAKDTTELEQINQENQKLSRKLFPPTAWDAWRENVEVFLVAIIIALAIRTYYVQPFKIPTGSMFPTLYGITPTLLPANQEPPSLPLRAWDMIIHGRSYTRLVTEKGGVVENMRPGSWFLWFEYTDFQIGGESFRVWLNEGQVRRDLRIMEGRPYEAGAVIANFMVDTGDQVLVNKITYHFRAPQLGEVFVFSTQGIAMPGARAQAPGEPPSSQFYIKRCVGLPGDTLEIQEPLLLVNGKPAEGSPIFKLNFDRVPPYGGYVYDSGDYGKFLNRPGATVTLGKDQYWAMGDNSRSSSDSRVWGPVPKENLVGTALLVYWPFTSRWGLIR